MLKSKRFLIPASLGLIALIALTVSRPSAQSAPYLELPVGCFDKQRLKIDQVPVDSMNIQKTVHAIDNEGRLFKIDLRNGRRTQLSDHKFFSDWPDITYEVSVEFSADKRWISYSHDLGDFTSTQYWLYDTQNESDRLALQTPAKGLGQSKISPDGRLLAVAVNYSDNWPDPNIAGIYLIETATLKQTRIKLPTKRALKDGLAHVDWSADGKELLVSLTDLPPHNEKDEFYSWHVAEENLEPVSGKYDQRLYKVRFSRHGVEVPVAPDRSPQSKTALTELASPTGAWHAQFSKPGANGNFSLEVQGKDGSLRTVFTGRSEACHEAIIRQNGASILAWLDEHHLVFKDGQPVFFVFDVATGKTALLFDGSTDTHLFMW